MIAQIATELITNFLMPIVISVITTGVGVVLTMILAKWNSFVKGKVFLQKLEINSQLEQVFENKVVQGIRFVVEQEAKQIKVNPAFKFAGEEKLSMVLDFLGGDKVIVDWLTKTGKNASVEVEHYLQKYRPTIENKVIAVDAIVAGTSSIELPKSNMSPNETVQAVPVKQPEPPEPMGPAF